MLCILLFSEIFLTFLFSFAIGNKLFKMHCKIWLYQTMSFLRIFLIFTLAFDYHLINNSLIETVQMLIIFMMIGVFCIGILHETLVSIL